MSGYDVRDQNNHHLLFGYRAQPDIKGLVQKIADGSGDNDMIMDLSIAAVLGKKYPEPLKAINFDMALLDEAESKSRSLRTLLGVAKGEVGGDSNAKKNRDAAYTFTKNIVDEIREFGQYVFWRDEVRKKGYASAYKRRSRQAAAAKKNQ